jgi:3-deoxy-manno-octulosonate cytidylyltransferase (CMP-KDO synthetase)
MSVHVALIPARLEASRFPSKLLFPLKGKSVIARTYENTVASGLFDKVIVVTDSVEIGKEIDSIKGQWTLSKKSHESGTDRIAEVAENMEADVIVNVQGDTPFVNVKALSDVLQAFQDPEVGVASIVQALVDPSLISDPNYVKVVLSNRNDALYFSRSAIPFNRDGMADVPYWEHVGVYAFRPVMLQSFVSWPQSPLELIEKIECLRFLERGYAIKMIISEPYGVEIDTPADIPLAEKFMAINHLD